jgi:hypothetical protein
LECCLNTTEAGDEMYMSRALWAVAAVCCLAAIGCGDDGSASASDTTTKSEYVQAVKERCGEYQQERSAAVKPLHSIFASDPRTLPPDELEQHAGDVAAFTDTTREVFDDIEDLPRPEADAARLEDAFANFDDARDALDRADAAAAEGDGAALAAAFGALDRSLRDIHDLGQEFGFSACE